MSENPFDKYEEFKVSDKIKKSVLKTSSAKMNPSLTSVTLKYGLTFLSSLILSLSLCPQRGVGLFGNESPFFHHLLHQSEVLCGLYCGLVFFLTTHLLTFLFLSHFERLKIIKHFTFVPILFMSGFFGFSMTSFFSDFEFGISYNLSWIAVIALSYVGLNYFYSEKLNSR